MNEGGEEHRGAPRRGGRESQDKANKEDNQESKQILMKTLADRTPAVLFMAWNADAYPKRRPREHVHVWGVTGYTMLGFCETISRRKKKTEKERENRREVRWVEKVKVTL